MLKKIILCFLVLAWMLVIFHFSSETGKVSESRSIAITKVVVNTSAPSPSKTQDYWIRKAAHVSEYTILALLVVSALQVGRARRRKYIVIALLICLIYAGSDELHQYFVSGRDGRVIDVLIDGVGVTIGLLLFNLIDKVQGLIKNYV